MEGRCIQLSLLGEQTKTYLSSIFPEGRVFSRIYGVAKRNMAQGHAGIREVYVLLSFLTPAKDLGFRGACDWVSYVLNLGLLPTHPTWDCPMYIFFSTGHGSSRQETWTISQRIFFSASIYIQVPCYKQICIVTRFSGCHLALEFSL